MTDTVTENESNAKRQAELQYESVKAMVNRLEHCNECDGGDDCELEDAEILEGLNLSGDTATDEERAEYHNEDRAREAIQEDALSIEVRGGWHSPGESADDEEFQITLCTGGPAVRIRGEIGQFNQADRAWLEFQDWFVPWQQYFGAESRVLCAYANEFLGF